MSIFSNLNVVFSNENRNLIYVPSCCSLSDFFSLGCHERSTCVWPCKIMILTLIETVKDSKSHIRSSGVNRSRHSQGSSSVPPFAAWEVLALTRFPFEMVNADCFMSNLV